MISIVYFIALLNKKPGLPLITPTVPSNLAPENYAWALPSLPLLHNAAGISGPQKPPRALTSARTCHELEGSKPDSCRKTGAEKKKKHIKY